MDGPVLAERGRPFGRYLLGQRIAVGGMGEVYLGVQLGLGSFQKPLVLKLMLPHLSEDPSSVQMFLDEAHLAAQMNHPNVVQVFDVGVQDGRYFIAMELVRGVSLSSLVRALSQHGRQVSGAMLAHVARGLCAGLEHAHTLIGRDGRALGVVHRDVTPQNVLISASGEVKLVDFGIAKARDSQNRTAPGIVKGKFEYLAPEQLQSGAVDCRADLYGAGVTLFQLATLNSPFRRDTDALTFWAASHEPLPSLALARPDLPLTLVSAIERAAAKDLNARFTSAQAMAAALPAPENGADVALAELVLATCRDRLHRLEAATEMTRALQVNTQEVPATATEKSSGARTWTGWAALAGAGIILAAWGVGSQRPVPAPAMVVAPAVPSPPVAVTPEPATAPAPPPAPAMEAPVPSPPVTTSAPRKARGYVTLDALPWATVSVDGVKVGDTPIDSLPLNSGTSTVVFSNPSLKKRVVRKVTVKPGATVFVKVDLR